MSRRFAKVKFTPAPRPEDRTAPKIVPHDLTADEICINAEKEIQQKELPPKKRRAGERLEEMAKLSNKLAKSKMCVNATQREVISPARSTPNKSAQVQAHTGAFTSEINADQDDELDRILKKLNLKSYMALR